MNEFDRIATYLAPLAAGSDAALGLGDDAAVWRPVPGQDLVMTTDTMVSGVHFLDTDGPRAIAAKLLRVNLSDLAAMGAQPVGFLLNTALGDAQGDTWLAEFAAGLGEDVRRYRVPLLGGDSVATPGCLTLTITAIGTVGQGRALLRSGARPGDDVYVSGTIGDAGFGLAVKLGGLSGLPERLSAPLLARLHWPEPRLALGRALAEAGSPARVSACIDISDGLLQDLGHIARMSGVAMRLQAPALPLSDEAAELVADMPDRLAGVFTAGDDYELGFTAPSDARGAIATLARQLELRVSRIGAVVQRDHAASPHMVVLDAAGKTMEIAGTGYQHFI